jgi:hypothetical protein
MFSAKKLSVIILAALVSVTAHAFTCPATPTGTVYFRAGDELRVIDTATNALSVIALIRAGVDRNAMGWDPLSRAVYATGGGTDSSVATLNNDGTFSPSSFNTAPNVGFAGGTMLPDGRWFIATQSDLYQVRSVVAGAGFGSLLSTGTISPTAGGGISGDVAYRSSDNRIYFIGPGSNPNRVSWIDPTTFAVTQGPLIAWPSGSVSTSAGPLGFDALGNLFTQQTTGVNHTFFKFDAATLGGASSTTITPIIIGSRAVFAGTDGFSCLPEVVSAPTPALTVPTLGMGWQWFLGACLLMMALLALPRKR